MAEQLANLSQSDNGKLINSTAVTTNVPHNTWTSVASVEAKANHTYIICASSNYTQNVSSVVTVDRLYGTRSGVLAIVRNPNGMYNGGGVCLLAIVRPTADETITFDEYQNSGQTRTVYMVNMNAYQLD